MTRKRYPWEKGCADLSSRLIRIYLEPALSPHVGRATARHTQVTAPTVKRFFFHGVSPRERSRYAISMTESLADARSGAVRSPFLFRALDSVRNIASHYTTRHMHIIDVNIFANYYIKKHSFKIFYIFNIFALFIIYIFFYIWNIFLILLRAVTI